MKNVLSITIGIIVLVVIVIYAATSYSDYQQQKMDTRVQAAVDEFAATIENSGELTMEEYYRLVDKLSSNGSVDIEIEYVVPNDINK